MADDGGGWIKVYWKLKDSVAGSSAVSTGVWIQLLLRACHRTKVLRNGTKLEPGEVIISEVGFAEDMEVSRKVMRRLINLFESEGMVKVAKRDRNGTKLSICNWGTYQNATDPKGHKRDSNGTATEQERNNNEHQTESPKIPKSPKKRAAVADNPPSLDEVAQYIREKGYGIDAEEFIAGNQQTGWLTKKGPIVDWKSAVVTWEKNRKKWAKESEQSKPQVREPQLVFPI